jgi:hypothetical protein
MFTYTPKKTHEYDLPARLRTCVYGFFGEQKNQIGCHYPCISHFP